MIATLAAIEKIFYSFVTFLVLCCCKKREELIFTIQEGKNLVGSIPGKEMTAKNFVIQQHLVPRKLGKKECEKIGVGDLAKNEVVSDLVDEIKGKVIGSLSDKFKGNAVSEEVFCQV